MLIKNGTIFDGTGSPRVEGDIRIEGEMIREIGKLKEHRGEEIIDAAGHFVCPGFVDILNHSDVHLTLFSHPGQRALVRQGITTILVGLCGTSLAPLTRGQIISAVQKWADPSQINVNWHTVAEFLDELERHSLRLNVATLAGHTTLRRGVADDEFRALDAKELEQMKLLLEGALRDGAFGLSLGLGYSHAKPATTGEFEALAHMVSKQKALLALHLRDEAQDLGKAVEEALAIARNGEVSVHISHLKAMGEGAWPQFDEALGHIDDARKNGREITFDAYPYLRTASVFYPFLPDWVAEGGKHMLLQRLAQRETYRRVVQEMQKDHRAYETMIVASGRLDPLFLGKSFGEIARNQNVSAEEVALNLLRASQDRLTVFTQTLSEENLRKAFTHPAAFVASDSSGQEKSEERSGNFVHPRAFGAFPRFFAEYVRKKNALSWEEAIAKATGRPAEKIGLSRRGKLTRGWYADVVIFDPFAIEDRATFEMPYQYPVGMHSVLVNGQVAFRNEKTTKARSGQILRKMPH